RETLKLSEGGTCRKSVSSCNGAPPLEHEHVPPGPVQPAQFLPPSHLPEPRLQMHRDTGPVFGEDAGLQSPEPGPFRLTHQSCQEQPADPLSACGGGHVHAYLGDTAVGAPVRDGREGGPPEDIVAVSRNNAALFQM